MVQLFERFSQINEGWYWAGGIALSLYSFWYAAIRAPQIIILPSVHEHVPETTYDLLIKTGDAVYLGIFRDDMEYRFEIYDRNGDHAGRGNIQGTQFLSIHLVKDNKGQNGVEENLRIDHYERGEREGSFKNWKGESIGVEKGAFTLQEILENM